jgi:hypothetical protein
MYVAGQSKRLKKRGKRQMAAELTHPFTSIVPFPLTSLSLSAALKLPKAANAIENCRRNSKLASPQVGREA